MSPLISRHPDAIHTDLGSESVLLLGETGAAFRLNETARAIWMRLPATREALCDTLVRTFAVDAGRARGDIDAVVANLLAQGLVSETPSGA